MAYQPGDAKITTIKRTFINEGNGTQPAYEIHFTIRGEGDYAVKVPADGYTAQVGLDAITRVAREICETYDSLK